MTIAADNTERRTGSSRRRIRLQFSLATLLVVVLVVAVTCAVGNYFYTNWMVAQRPIPWQDYTPELLERLEEEQRPVLIHFVADWDAVMHVLKVSVLESPEVSREIRQHGMAAILVDWTHDSPEVRSLFRKYKVTEQIPLTIVLSGEVDQQPVILPGGFTPETIIEAIRAAAPIKPQI